MKKKAFRRWILSPSLAFKEGEGVRKYWGAKWWEGDIISYEKQEESGKIVIKLGKVTDILMKTAQINKENRYYLVDDGEYAVHEDLVIDGIFMGEHAEIVRKSNDLVRFVEMKRKCDKMNNNNNK